MRAIYMEHVDGNQKVKDLVEALNVTNRVLTIVMRETKKAGGTRRKRLSHEKRSPMSRKNKRQLLHCRAKKQNPVDRWIYGVFDHLLAETEGFEPSIQVLAQMLP